MLVSMHLCCRDTSVHETGPDSQTSTLSLWSRIMSLSKTANPTNFTVCNTKHIHCGNIAVRRKIIIIFSISETLHFFVVFDIHKLVKCSDYWWGPVLNWVHQPDHTESKWWVLIFWQPKRRQCDLVIKDKSFHNTWTIFKKRNWLKASSLAQNKSELWHWYLNQRPLKLSHWPY